MKKKPNILLLITDTQRCDTLACMGSPFARSPGLDRLASQGVLFDQAHTSAPVCGPARCSLLTGTHTPIHGAIENGMRRRTDLPVFPDALEEAGYTNIMVGKAHFDPIPDSFRVQQVIRGEKGSDSDDFYAEHIRRAGYSRASSHPNPIPPELFMDAFLADTAIREIDRAADGGAPFFVLCSMPSPHSPIDPPGPWAGLYDEVKLPELNYVEGEIERLPIHQRRLLGFLPDSPRGAESSYSDGPFDHLREAVGNTIVGKPREDIDAYRRLYYGLAAYCDAQVARIIDHLDARGLREETLVIFTSDHGLQLFDHGFNDKHNFYDASWRVPLILSMPGTIPAGGRRDFAIWNDITATILGTAGAGAPWVQGFDLLPALAAGEPSPRRCAVGTVYRSAALATGRWKLAYYLDEAEGRLYDRAADPLEREDLFSDAAHRDVREQLLRALLTWRGSITDVAQLAASTSGGGGPVARRLAPHTMAMRGADAESRLNRAVGGLDGV